ncbi:lysophospholipid acyltransferase [Entophlyctis luteolus]|nr:lysophospholipid acyltransferase [Entophlyctis luteolus]
MGAVDMQWLQDATGLDKGLIGPGIVMIAAYALTAPFALLESPVLRNLFSVIVSSVLFMALFNVHGVVQITILSIVCYSLSRSFPHSKNVPWIVLALSLGTLAANHIIHQVLSDNASRFDETVPMMVVIQKTAMFAWSVYDGTRSDRLLSNTQKYLKIDSESMPSLLEYLGFIYFYPSFWVGPSFQFKTYFNFIHGKGEFSPVNGSRLLPGRWPYFTKTIFIGIICTASNIFLDPYLQYSFALTDDYLKFTFIERVAFIFAAAFSQQLQFYGAWKLSEGACILCGFGYVGPDPSKENNYLWNSGWNVQTALWLRNAIYLRLSPEKLPDQTLEEQKAARHMLGADPGYYIFFGTLSLLVTCNRIVRKYIRPLFHDPAGHPLLYKLLPAYHFVGWLTTSLSIYYGTIGMQLKWFNYGMTVWSRLYFFVHVGIAVLYALDYAMSAKGPKRRDGRRAGDKTHENVDLTHAQKKEN